MSEFKPGPDSHGAVNSSRECVVITIPVTGWYAIAGESKEIYLLAGTQLILNAAYGYLPANVEVRTKG